MLIPQSSLLSSSPLSISKNSFDLQLKDYKSPHLTYSKNGNNLLITSHSGHSALIDIDNFTLRSELTSPHPILSQTFLTSTFYAQSHPDKILINDFDGLEIQSLDYSNLYHNCFFLSYSHPHSLLTSLNRRGALSYFDISCGKSVFNTQSNLNLNALSPRRQSAATESFNGVLAIANCAGKDKFNADKNRVNEGELDRITDMPLLNELNKEKEKEKMVTGRRNGMISFFSPKSKDSLAEITATETGVIKAISMTSTSMSTYNLSNLDNELNSILVSVDSKDNISFFDVRNYFKPFKTLKTPFINKNTRLKQSSEKGYEQSTVLRGIENIQLKGDLMVLNDSSTCEVYRINSDLSEELIFREVSNNINSVALRPFSSSIGYTSDCAFSSRAVLGIGTTWEKEINTFDENFAFHSKGTKKARQNMEVNSLLNKLPPQSIRLEFLEEEEKENELLTVEKETVGEIKELNKKLRKLNNKIDNVKVNNSTKKRLSKLQRVEIKKKAYVEKKKVLVELIKEKKKEFGVIKDKKEYYGKKEEIRKYDPLKEFK